MHKSLLLAFILGGFFSKSYSQKLTFTHADSLRGTLSPLRDCFDVYFYDLEVKADPAKEYITGTNRIHFKAVKNFQQLQIDLFANMQLDSILFRGKKQVYEREANAVFISLSEPVSANEEAMLSIFYQGSPIQAKLPPWDGGFIWRKDTQENPWIAVACEGIGASLWWPLKDHLSDEPDSLHITVTAPDSLMAVSNGRLYQTSIPYTGWKSWHWRVSYPINSYNVTLNIGNYAHFNRRYLNASGQHDLDYYVLKYNLEKAKKHFEQVPEMLQVYEEAFGEYPFWKDGYALVETPYPGMEHQGAIAYGNKYRHGYNGMAVLGLPFDYIIIHETGHEWWGNSVSCDDHAELWIHESFCTYGEAVYVEALYGKDTAQLYLNAHRNQILNVQPIVGPRGVNFDHFTGNDMYYKGAWMLHTLRNYIDNDSLWKATLKSFAEDHRYQVINTKQVIAYFNKKLDLDLGAFFQQYLYVASPPRLQYKLNKRGRHSKLRFRWDAAVSDFNLPLWLDTPNGPMQVPASTEWQKLKLKNIPPKQLRIDKNKFYGYVNRL